MVKVSVELSKYEIQMLVNCIDGAIDTKHMRKENENRVKEIKEQLEKYL